MVKIREANISDCALIAKLAKLSFIDTFGYLYSADNLSSHLEIVCSEDYFKSSIKVSKILLAETDGELVGYIKFGQVEIPMKNIKINAKEIHRLYIHPNYKRKNIGTNLMDETLSDYNLKSAKNLYLSVYENNEPAKSFYKNYGFKKIGEYNYHVGKHIDLEHIMHKEI